MISLTLFLSTLEHAHFLELHDKENAYLHAASNINFIKIWLTSKLYVKPSCTLFKISIFQGVYILICLHFKLLLWRVKGGTSRGYIRELFSLQITESNSTARNINFVKKIQKKQISGSTWFNWVWKVNRHKNLYLFVFATEGSLISTLFCVLFLSHSCLLLFFTEGS